METRLSNIFKTTNVTNLNKVIQESSYRVLKVTSKQKTLKQPVYFLKTVEFFSTFNIQIAITLAIFWEKLQNYTFQKTHRSLSKHANIHILINRASHYEITALQKYEKFEFLLATPFFFFFFFFQLLTFGIFNESNIWAKVYHIWEMEVQGSTIVEITGRRSCYFIEYRLDQLNSKHTKTAVNSTIQYFEGHSQEKCMLKV